MMENLTPQEQLRMRDAGERPPPGYADWDDYARQQQAERHRIMGQDRAGRGAVGVPSDAGTAWTLTMLTMPFVIAIAAMFVLSGWIVAHAAGYREILEMFLPDDVVASGPGQPGKPGTAAIATGAVVLAPIVGLTVARRIWQRLWAKGPTGTGTFLSVSFGISFVRTALIIAAPAVVLGAVGIAQAKDLEPGATEGLTTADGWWPFALTLIAIVLWAGVSTLRSRKRAYALTHEHWSA